MPHLLGLSTQHLSFRQLGHLFLSFRVKLSFQGMVHNLSSTSELKSEAWPHLNTKPLAQEQLDWHLQKARTGLGNGQIHPMEASRDQMVQFMPTSVPRALILTRCLIFGSVEASVT